MIYLFLSSLSNIWCKIKEIAIKKIVDKISNLENLRDTNFGKDVF